MSEYRDYGQTILPGSSGGVGQTDIPVNSFRQGQVYQATHKGDQRLPYMYRSFISFTYGGKHIEDFNLIATIDGDRMNKQGYSSFNDITSTYDSLDGQQYWGTHFEAKTLEIHLSTDGIDQKMLDDFLYWFRPGEAKELILAEHPNRAILARISEPPQLSLLSFEEPVEISISTYTYMTRTTKYRGEIELKFVMDEPHWYAKENLLGIKDGDRYLNRWIDANGNTVEIFASQDALKILYEDGIPLGSMIENNMLLGNGAFASVEGQTISKVWSIANDEDIEWSGGSWGQGDPSGEGARTEDSANPTRTFGIIAGAIIDATGNGISSLPTYNNNNKNVGHFFYSGTAPAPAIITFTMTPTLSNGYVISPRNSKTSPKYNTITIESRTVQELKFTTPNILTSFNKVIEIFEAKVSNDYSWEDVRQSIRDEIRHRYVREWAIKIVDTMIANNMSRNSSTLSTMRTAMSYFLRNMSGEYYPMTFTFNSETGEAKGIFSYRTVTNSTVSDWSTYGNLSLNQEEDVGDMLRSNYIIIRDRNYPTATGAIQSWTVNGKEQSHRIYHDVATPLSNLSILYKNMYL